MYTSGLDGKTMYSVRMEVPNTGTIFEVIADHVDKKWQDDFEPYQERECGPMNHVPFTQKQLKHTWTKEGGKDVNSSTIGTSGEPASFGLPLLLMVQVAHPASGSLDDLKTYLEENAGYSNHYMEHKDSTQECTWSDLTVPQLIAAEDGEDDDSSSSVAVKLNLRLTKNKKAKQGHMSASFYGHYTTTTIQETVGNNEGYSRYLDNHIGIDISNVRSLDENAQILQSNNYAFHSGGGLETASDGSGNNDDIGNVGRRKAMGGMESHDKYAGSNWARGKSGVNFEFRGSYNGSFFNTSDIVQLDYCSPSGFSKKGVSDVTYCPEPAAAESKL